MENSPSSVISKNLLTVYTPLIYMENSPTQPIQNNTTELVNNSNTKAKSRKGTIIKISIAIVSILLILCMISTIAIGFTASANLGKRNSLSMITQIVPTENIPVLKEFGKTLEQIVDDALYIKIDEDYASTLANTKKFEGALVSNSNIQSSLLVTTQSDDVTGNF